MTLQDWTNCMHALQHTTHPSAFLPAFVAAEAMLRGYSHPNFIRWSLRNINRPRALFARAVGTLLIVLALTIDLVLILSSFNRLVRLSALPLWYVGLYILFISGRGISIRLYMNRKRQLRPWEQVPGLDCESASPSGVKGKQAEPKSPVDPAKHKRNDIPQTNPPRKWSLQALGPANDFAGEPWVRLYQEKPIWHRVFGVHVVNHSRHLRALQDRAVLASLLWASLLVVILNVGSVLIPSANLF